MKNRKISTYLVIFLLSMSIMVACSNDEEIVKEKTEPLKVEKENGLKELTTKDLAEKFEDSSWIIVDTRLNDAYNGWSLDGVTRGGHIKGAVDFSANWLSVDNENKEELLNKALETKEITKDKNIVLYDANGKDAQKVGDYLKEKGYENIHYYDVNQWAKDETLPMESYKNYHLIVPAEIVKAILDGEKPETFELTDSIKIVEASWGEEDVSYGKGHVPTSVHINTDTVEPPPTWMLGTDEELTNFAHDYGFTKDDTIVVTSANQMAAYRVAVVLRYMGVKDVRVLNGGLDAWVAAGYEVETAINELTPGNDFGADIPANSDLVDTIEEAKIGLESPDTYTLVDNRTWLEHIGEISGYSYHDKKGRIPGSVYGYAGFEGPNSLDYYRNIDNTMRNADEVLKLWAQSEIDTNTHLAFMCGSGWRAAEVLTYAQVMGLEDTSLYSDGWIGWSNDLENPTVVGEPKE